MTINGIPQTAESLLLLGGVVKTKQEAASLLALAGIAPAKSRHFKPCECHYQREHSWGYDLQRWIGGAKSWRVEGWGTAAQVEKRAETIPVVLIRCRGCGNDMLREYPATKGVA